MYNRYIPGSGGYTRVTVREKDDRPSDSGERKRPDDHRRSQGGRGQSASFWTGANPQDMFRRLTDPLSFFGGEDKNAGIAGILKSLHLEDLDSGDVLLLLIILFLFLEGDNIELVITLGLMLLFGLGEEKKEDQKE